MKYALLTLALLLLVAACAQKQTQPTGAVVATSADGVGSDGVQDGCSLMKHTRVGVHDCFGCSNGNCREADAQNWEPADGSSTRIRCIASPRGCVVA